MYVMKRMRYAMSAANVLEEYLKRHEFIKLDGEPRLVIHLGDQ